MADSDRERKFIQRLVARDERAFNELIERYEQQVYGLVARMLVTPDEAEDLTQEVFVQFFKKIEHFRGDSKLSTWLFRVAINVCKNRARHLARRQPGTQEELDSVADRAAYGRAKGVTAGEASQPDQVVEGLQIEQIVRRCIAELPAEFREAIILRDVEAVSYEELVQITGVPEGTIKSRIHRARAMLKAKVEQRLGEKIG